AESSERKGNMIIRKVVTAIAAATLAAISVAGTAEAATHAPSAGKLPRRCVVVLDKLKPGQKVSNVVSRTCGTAAQVKAPNATVLLGEFWYDANYGGNSTQYYGRYGPCDADGYGIPTVGWP